jgi:histidine decarboxylase
MLNLFSQKEFTKPEANCLASYVLEMLTAINVNQLKQSFSQLPEDPYLEGHYRFRRLSHFKVVDDRLIRLPHRRLFQSKRFNPLLGDVTREYAELDDHLVELENFQRLVWQFFEFCQLCSTSNEIAVHQIRTTASSGKLGNPAPEGVHRDGVDVAGIFSVDRNAIDGGETHLYKQKDDEHPRFSKVLNPGEFLVFRDDQYFHYTSPVNTTTVAPGTRDVFVLTSPGLSPPEDQDLFEG